MRMLLKCVSILLLIFLNSSCNKPAKDDETPSPGTLKKPLTMVLTASSSSVHAGDALTLTATITGIQPSIPLLNTNHITFNIDAMPISKACTNVSLTGTDSKIATCRIDNIRFGSSKELKYSAVFSGNDPNYSAPSNAMTVVTMEKFQLSSALNANKTTAHIGDSIKLTATITGISGAMSLDPSGYKINFQDSSQTNIANCIGIPIVVTGSQGVAVCNTIASTPVGQKLYQAVIIGTDPNYDPPVKNATQTVTITSIPIPSQNWVPVGSAPFSTHEITNPALAIGNNHIPYIAYREWKDYSGKSALTVMKFDGKQWINITDFSVFATSLSVAIGKNNILYVAYLEGTKIAVKQYDGTQWSNVGNLNAIAANAADGISIAIDNNNIPYIAFIGPRANVMKFNGKDWVTVGIPNFSSPAIVDLKLAIGKNNIPYVAYVDIYNDDGLITILNYDGTRWNKLGNPADYRVGAKISIVMDAQNNMFIAYIPPGSANYATVMKFDGKQFQTVGSTNFCQTFATTHMTLGINSNNTLYLVSPKGVPGEIFMFDGVQWTNITKNIQMTNASASFAFDKNTLYLGVSYRTPGMAAVFKLED